MTMLCFNRNKESLLQEFLFIEHAHMRSSLIADYYYYYYLKKQLLSAAIGQVT